MQEQFLERLDSRRDSLVGTQDYWLDGQGAAFLPVWQDEEIVTFTVVDEDRVEELSKYRWRYERGYARYGRDRLHQVVLGRKSGFVIDHINRDKLDNRRENLRHLTPSQNQDGHLTPLTRNVVTYKHYP